MKNKNKLITILSIVFLLEVLSFSGYLTLRKEDATKKFNVGYEKMRYRYEKEMEDLKDKMETRRYQATGVSNYERAYNIQDQSIIELIRKITNEAVPKDWKIDIRVEEFFNFILILQVPLESKEIKKNYKYLIPIVQWSYPYLQNIAIFNKYHECVYYFDSNLITQIRKHKKINDNIIKESKKIGSTFTSYNSIVVPFARSEGHIFLPITIYGDNGLLDMRIMLDTGATTTIIAKEFAEKTLNEGDDENKNARIQQFSTVNGTIRCLVLKRNVVLGGFDSNIDVAVSMEEDTNLLGMNYFSDKNYLIDSNTENIYLWKK